MLEAGSVIQDKYVIERVLGQGGMGTVYEARVVALGNKRVAIKEMAVAVQTDEERMRALQQFRLEAQMLARLQHRGLVDVTDYFEQDDSAYLVMACVDGTTLEGVVGQAPGGLEVSTVIRFLDDICDVLEYLHSRDPVVVLRDLKPTNVMVDARGHVTLIDFGIARALSDAEVTCTFVKGAGTTGFAPPEQYGGATDARTDIYSLGATAYYLLTGIIPPGSVTLLTGEAELRPLRETNPQVSPALQAVVDRMMAVRKDERFQTVREARAALAAAAGGARVIPPEVVVSGTTTTCESSFPSTVRATPRSLDQLQVLVDERSRREAAAGRLVRLRWLPAGAAVTLFLLVVFALGRGWGVREEQPAAAVGGARLAAVPPSPVSPSTAPDPTAATAAPVSAPPPVARATPPGPIPSMPRQAPTSPPATVSLPVPSTAPTVAASPPAYPTTAPSPSIAQRLAEEGERYRQERARQIQLAAARREVEERRAAEQERARQAALEAGRQRQASYRPVTVIPHSKDRLDGSTFEHAGEPNWVPGRITDNPNF